VRKVLYSGAADDIFLERTRGRFAPKSTSGARGSMDLGGRPRWFSGLRAGETPALGKKRAGIMRAGNDGARGGEALYNPGEDDGLRAASKKRSWEGELLGRREGVERRVRERGHGATAQAEDFGGKEEDKRRERFPQGGAEKAERSNEVHRGHRKGNVLRIQDGIKEKVQSSYSRSPIPKKKEETCYSRKIYYGQENPKDERRGNLF